MAEHFSGQVAVVAGGTGALGTAVVLALLREGARVISFHRTKEGFAPVQSEAGRTGGTNLSGFALDVTDAAAVSSHVEQVIRAHGRLDLLINTVGAFSGGRNLWEENPETYDRMMGLNCKAGFLLARAVVPQMIRQNRGWIVSVASRAAYVPSAGAALYAASKAGALALFDSLAEEVKPYGIRVNSVVPSIMDTPANRKAAPAADYGLWPKPSEIADVILFLCSPAAQVVHGAAIPVYGKT